MEGKKTPVPRKMRGWPCHGSIFSAPTSCVELLCYDFYYPKILLILFFVDVTYQLIIGRLAMMTFFIVNKKGYAFYYSKIPIHFLRAVVHVSSLQGETKFDWDNVPGG
jgi:hypothetical protein